MVVSSMEYRSVVVDIGGCNLSGNKSVKCTRLARLSRRLSRDWGPLVADRTRRASASCVLESAIVPSTEDRVRREAEIRDQF